MSSPRLATSMQALNAIPDMHSPAHRRRVAAAGLSHKPRPRPAVKSPVQTRPAPLLPPANVDTVRALEHYLAETIGSIPRGAPERLQAYRYVFTAIIGQLPGHGALLAEVKSEYDATIEAIRSLQPAQPGQGTLHPLQLPSAYYEREMQRAKEELETSWRCRMVGDWTQQMFWRNSVEDPEEELQRIEKETHNIQEELDKHEETLNKVNIQGVFFNWASPKKN